MPLQSCVLNDAWIKSIVSFSPDDVFLEDGDDGSIEVNDDDDDGFADDVLYLVIFIIDISSPKLS